MLCSPSTESKSLHQVEDRRKRLVLSRSGGLRNHFDRGRTDITGVGGPFDGYTIAAIVRLSAPYQPAALKV